MPQSIWVQNRQKIDDDHLRLLSAFHFVMAGLSVLGLLFIVAHYAVMSSVFGNPEMWKTNKGGPPPQEFWWAFQWMYLLLGGLIVAGGVVNFLSGKYLRVKKNRMFCMIVAGVNCLNMPLGMILGVFTFVVLLRPSVRVEYGE